MDNVIEVIEFYLSQQGNFLFAKFKKPATELQKILQQSFPLNDKQISEDFPCHINHQYLVSEITIS